MKKDRILKKASKEIKRMRKDFAKTPLARAARGRRTRGFI